MGNWTWPRWQDSDLAGLKPRKSASETSVQLGTTAHVAKTVTAKFYRPTTTIRVPVPGKTFELVL